MVKVGLHLSNMVFPAEIFFHILTCVERYLAVVHPITYLGLKHSGRVRNIGAMCVWVLSFGWSSVLALCDLQFPIIPFFCLIAFSLIAVSFCSLRVLCDLIRPGPGEKGRNKECVGPSKQKAFHTIMAKMGVLWVWFVGYLDCFSLSTTQLLSYSDRCVVVASGLCFGLPSSLILPLLFIQSRKM